MTAHALTPEDFRDLARMLRKFRQNEFEAGRQPDEKKPNKHRPKVVWLDETLRPGKTAKATVLERSTATVWDIWIPEEQEHRPRVFRLASNGGWVSQNIHIDYNSKQLARILRTAPFARKVKRVTGRGGRWRVEFSGSVGALRVADPTIGTILINETDHYVSGTSIKVRSMIALESSIPAQRQCIVEHIPGAGWAVVETEKFTPRETPPANPPFAIYCGNDFGYTTDAFQTPTCGEFTPAGFRVFRFDDNQIPNPLPVGSERPLVHDDGDRFVSDYFGPNDDSYWTLETFRSETVGPTARLQLHIRRNGYPGGFETITYWTKEPFSCTGTTIFKRITQESTTNPGDFFIPYCIGTIPLPSCLTSLYGMLGVDVPPLCSDFLTIQIDWTEIGGSNSIGSIRVSAIDSTVPFMGTGQESLFCTFTNVDPRDPSVVLRLGNVATTCEITIAPDQILRYAAFRPGEWQHAPKCAGVQLFYVDETGVETEPPTGFPRHITLTPWN